MSVEFGESPSCSDLIERLAKEDDNLLVEERTFVQKFPLSWCSDIIGVELSCRC